jgi:hypothetical protein
MQFVPLPPPLHTHTPTPKLDNYHIELQQQSALFHVTWPFQAKDSFVPLFAALNIVADNPAGGDGGRE